MPHICVSEFGQHRYRQWLDAFSAPSNYLIQCLVIVKWTLRNSLSKIVLKIQNLSFTKMHLKIPSTKCRPFCPGRDELSSISLGKLLQWCHNERDSVSNHQPHDCLLKCLFGRKSKKTSKLRVTGLCDGNSPVTSEFPAQRASYAENASIWWRYHITSFRSHDVHY